MHSKVVRIYKPGKITRDYTGKIVPNGHAVWVIINGNLDFTTLLETMCGVKRDE